MLGFLGCFVSWVLVCLSFGFLGFLVFRFGFRVLGLGVFFKVWGFGFMAAENKVPMKDSGFMSSNCRHN